MIEFTPFPKIGRWTSNKIAVTEKIDGTNGLVHIEAINETSAESMAQSIKIEDDPTILFMGLDLQSMRRLVVRAGSRSRWLTPGKTTDNFGFAFWVQQNASALVKLGEGMHYGEWWGAGIQRRYGLTDGDKRFSLFNTGRWAAGNCAGIGPVYDKSAETPLKRAISVPGLGVVPQLYYGPIRDASGRCQIEAAMQRLQYAGSEAAPGFVNPEGVMVYFENLKVYSKAPFDPSPKNQ